MSRLEEKRIRVQRMKNKQYFCTIPKRIAQKLDLKKGSILEFSFDESKNEINLRRLE